MGGIKIKILKWIARQLSTEIHKTYIFIDQTLEVEKDKVTIKRLREEIEQSTEVLFLKGKIKELEEEIARREKYRRWEYDKYVELKLRLGESVPTDETGKHVYPL